MADAVHDSELQPETTEGFKVGEKKTIDEYQQLGEYMFATTFLRFLSLSLAVMRPDTAMGNLGAMALFLAFTMIEETTIQPSFYESVDGTCCEPTMEVNTSVLVHGRTVLLYTQTFVHTRSHTTHNDLWPLQWTASLSLASLPPGSLSLTGT